MTKKKKDETVETKETVALEEADMNQENQNTEEKGSEPESQDPEEKNSEPENQESEQKNPETEEKEADQENNEPEKEEETATEEQVLFHVTPKEKRVALRSTPEFRLDNKNLAGIVDENSTTRTFKVVEQKNGYGRLLYPEGLWIDLKACNRF